MDCYVLIYAFTFITQVALVGVMVFEGETIAVKDVLKVIREKYKKVTPKTCTKE